MFRNLWDPLRELIVRLKIMRKSHINICPICLHLWNIMNFLLITFNYFYKTCSKWPPCIWRQACTRLVIDLVILSIIPGVSRICRKPCSILFRSISAFSIDVAYTIDFKCPHKWKSNGFKSGERAGHTNRTSTTNPFICKVLI